MNNCAWVDFIICCLLKVTLDRGRKQCHQQIGHVACLLQIKMYHTFEELSSRYGLTDGKYTFVLFSVGVKEKNRPDLRYRG